MKKLNFATFYDLVSGAGMGVTLAEVSVNRVDTQNFVRDDNCKLTCPNLYDPKYGSNTNITANIKLAYAAGYNVYLTLLFLGQDYDHHITDNMEICKLIARDEFEISSDGSNSAHAIEWLTADAKAAIDSLGDYSAELHNDDNFIYLQDHKNVENLMMDYQEALGLGGGRYGAMFDESLRVELDSRFRDEAIKMLSM